MKNDDNYIKRNKCDEYIFQNAKKRLDELNIVSTNSIYCANKAKSNNQAVNLILNYYGISREEMEKLDDIDIIYRKLKLDGDWWKYSGEPLISIRQDGEYIALIPSQFNGYYYIDENRNKKKICHKNQSLFQEAYNFCKKFPNGKIKPLVFAKYIMQFISAADIFFICVLSFFTVFAGIYIPKTIEYLLDSLEKNQIIAKLFATFWALFFATIYSVCANVAINLFEKSITQKCGYSVRNAILMRIFELDKSKRNNATKISFMQNVYDMCGIVNIMVFNIPKIITTVLFFLSYIIQVSTYMGNKISWIILILLIQVIIVIPFTIHYKNVCLYLYDNRKAEQNIVSMISSGLPKIQQINAEKRIFAIWGKSYEKYLANTLSKNAIININKIIPKISSYIITIIIMIIVVYYKKEISDYVFLIMVTGLIVNSTYDLVNMFFSIAECSVLWKNSKLICEDTYYNKRVSALRIDGSIKIENLSFSYDDSRMIIDKLNLSIKEKEYVAIVGSSGVGKSTLLNLMMGTLNPNHGAIWYGKTKLTKGTQYGIMRNVRFVSQSDMLVSGTIRDNVEMCVKNTTDSEIWEVLEKVGMADFIHKLPYGLDTKINSGVVAFSQGQVQRLVLARAIISKPRIIILDEATSALDNISQKIIKEILDSMECTKIVVAHRLSTIKHCDKIYLLENGGIIEEGNYDELMNKKGKFYELVYLQENANRVIF